MTRTTLTRWIAAAGLVVLAAGALAGAAGLAGATTAMLAGGTLLVAVLLLHGRAVLSVLRGRAARRGADALLATLFFTGILVVVQATSMRHARVLDLTRNQRHTLAPQTLAVLDHLDRDVEATAFVRQASPTRAGVDELLRLYARRSPRFRYTLVDPDRHPDQAARLDASPDEIVVASGDVRRVARNAGEESVTNALVQVTRTGARIVYVVSGHGEREVSSDARDGYSAARAGLEAQGYEVRPLSLLNTSRVPEDAAVVVIAGPRNDYLPVEVALLETYAGRGGSLLFLLDPRANLPELSRLLATFSLALVDVVVLDDRVLDANDRTFDATVAKVRRYERHAITRGFNFLTLYPRAGAVRILEDRPAPGAEANYLGISDEEAWGEVDMERFAAGTATRDGDDIAGPLPVSAACEVNIEGSPSRRAVLVADSDFAGNVFYGVLGNADFFQNAMAWLSEDETLISIRPRTATGDSIYMTASQGRLVFALCVVALPLAAIATGAVVAWRRRRV